jgi:hypothetical protein
VIGCGFLECGARLSHGFFSIPALSPMLADGMKVAVRLLSVNSFPRDPNIPDEEKSKPVIVGNAGSSQFILPPSLES